MWPFRRSRRHALDPEVLLADIGQTMSGYGPVDRYADFRRVFGTPEGRRVLHQICRWGRVFTSLSHDADPNVNLRNEGERRLALLILATINKPPVEKPVVATKRLR